MNRWDTIAVLAVPLASFVAFFLLGFQTSYLGSLILFFLFPSLYLSLRNAKKVRKIAIFTVLAVVPLYFIMDLLAYIDRAWIVPASLFPFRVLGLLPVEDFVWLFLVTYLILMLYESLSEQKFSPAIGGRVKVMCAVLYPLMILMIGLFCLYPSLHLPYSFDLFGFGLLLIPAVLFVVKFPSYALTFLKVQVLFTVIHLPFEMVGDRYGFWLYIGTHYAGWLQVLGVWMPLEEMVFVMVFGAFAACAYYVFFAGPSPNRMKNRVRPRIL